MPRPLPSTPALLEKTSKSPTSRAARASMTVCGMTDRPKPPAAMDAPAGMSATASAAARYLLDIWMVLLGCRGTCSGNSEHPDGSLPHVDPSDLAGHGHGERVRHVDVLGDLVAGQLAGGELAQRRGREVRRARLELHPGHELLPVLGVRDADDLGVEDVRGGVEELLDLVRGDVLASAVQHVFGAA